MHLGLSNTDAWIDAVNVLSYRVSHVTMIHQKHVIMAHVSPLSL